MYASSCIIELYSFNILIISIIHYNITITITTNIITGTNIARGLAAIPPNVLYPASYARVVQDLAETNGWGIDTWSADQLRQMGCGAFCAVSNGNPCDASGVVSDCLVRLLYTPEQSNEEKDKSTAVKLNEILYNDVNSSTENGQGKGNNNSNKDKGSLLRVPEKKNRNKPVVLVGKGVTYDTGGVNTKTANSMKTMKMDMAGSSAALGTFHALSKVRS